MITRFFTRAFVLGLGMLVAFELGHALPQQGATIYPDADGGTSSLVCTVVNDKVADCTLPVQVGSDGGTTMGCTTIQDDPNGNPSQQVCWPLIVRR